MEHIIWLHHRLHRLQLPCSTTTATTTKKPMQNERISYRESTGIYRPSLHWNVIRNNKWSNRMSKTAQTLNKNWRLFLWVRVCANAQNVMQIVFTMIFLSVFSIEWWFGCFVLLCLWWLWRLSHGYSHRYYDVCLLKIKRVLLYRDTSKEFEMQCNHLVLNSFSVHLLPHQKTGGTQKWCTHV